MSYVVYTESLRTAEGQKIESRATYEPKERSQYSSKETLQIIIGGQTRDFEIKTKKDGTVEMPTYEGP